MIQKWLCVILLIAMIGCKPESPVTPDNDQEEMFTLYVDNIYNVDQDIVIYMQPFSMEMVIDYVVNGGLNKVGVAYGGELTEIGIFACDSLTYLTGIYDLEMKNPITTVELYATGDTVNTVEISDYTWVFDEQTKWVGGIFNIITP